MHGRNTTTFNVRIRYIQCQGFFFKLLNSWLPCTWRKYLLKQEGFLLDCCEQAQLLCLNLLCKPSPDISASPLTHRSNLWMCRSGAQHLAIMGWQLHVSGVRGMKSRWNGLFNQQRERNCRGCTYPSVTLFCLDKVETRQKSGAHPFVLYSLDGVGYTAPTTQHKTRQYHRLYFSPQKCRLWLCCIVFRCPQQYILSHEWQNPNRADSTVIFLLVSKSISPFCNRFLNKSLSNSMNIEILLWFCDNYIDFVIIMQHGGVFDHLPNLLRCIISV